MNKLGLGSWSLSSLTSKVFPASNTPKDELEAAFHSLPPSPQEDDANFSDEDDTEDKTDVQPRVASPPTSQMGSTQDALPRVTSTSGATQGIQFQPGIEDLKNKIKKLKDKNKSWKEKFQEQTRLLEELQTEKDELELKVQNTDSSVQTTSKDIDYFKKLSESRGSILERLRKERDKLQEEKEKLIEKNKTLKKRISEKPKSFSKIKSIFKVYNDEGIAYILLPIGTNKSDSKIFIGIIEEDNKEPLLSDVEFAKNPDKENYYDLTAKTLDEALKRLGGFISEDIKYLRQLATGGDEKKRRRRFVF